MSKTGEEATPTEVKIDNHAIQNTEQIPAARDNTGK